MLGSILAAVSQRKLWTEDRIKSHVARTVKETSRRLHDHTPESEHEGSADELKALLIFSTPKQRTWLVADRWSVYFVLDDVRREDPRVQWIARRTEMQPTRAKYDYSPESGVLYFGPQGKEWLFSKDLFQGRDVVECTRQFLGSGAQ